MRKISVSVYRYETDATNKGATSPDRGFRWFALYLTMPEPHEIEAEIARGAAPLLLDKREGTPYPPIARPLTPEALTPDGEPQRGMFGGNFLWSSDSRFRELVSHQPIAVHDRFERGTY